MAEITISGGGVEVVDKATGDVQAAAPKAAKEKHPRLPKGPKK